MRPPRHLAVDTKKWWLSVVKGYDLDEHHVKLLTLACETFDRCNQARKAIDEHGMIFNDRFGCPKARPEAAIERDSRIAFARLLRELDLDLEPPADVKRPPQLYRYHGPHAA